MTNDDLLEIGRLLESLEEAIERGHVEAGKQVWEAMKTQCYWERGERCNRNDDEKCTYNNCPIMEKYK